MKKNLIHRICALLLVLVLSVSAVPAAFAESDPVSTLMEQFDNRVKAPKEASLLDEPEQGIHLVPIIDAGVKIEEGYPVYEEGVQNGYFCRNARNSKSFAKGTAERYEHIRMVIMRPSICMMAATGSDSKVMRNALNGKKGI